MSVLLIQNWDIIQGKEDEYDKQLKGIIFSILGLGMIGLAGETVKILNFGSGCNDLKGLAIPCVEGGFLKNPSTILRTVTLFNQKTQNLGMKKFHP